MNPQLYLLDKFNLLIPIQNLILQNLTSDFATSHEIENKIIKSPEMIKLKSILSTYPASGFSESSSFIGAVSSDMSHQGHVKHSIKYCTVTKSKKNAFRI